MLLSRLCQGSTVTFAEDVGTEPEDSARDSAAGRIAILAASIITALVVNKVGDRDTKIKPLMTSAWKVSHVPCAHSRLHCLLVSNSQPSLPQRRDVD